MDASLLPESEQLDRIGTADLVIGILGSHHGENHGENNGDATEKVRESVAAFPQLSRAVVVCNNGNSPPLAEAAMTGSSSPAIFLCRLPAPAAAEMPRESRSRICRSVFAMAGKLGARACGLVAAERDSVTLDWLQRLIQPVLELRFDLVAPQYTRRKMEGLLNRSILAPLHRALYGGILHNPLGPDFGLSQQLLGQLAAQDFGRTRGGQDDPAVSFASTAACGGMQICEAYLGVHHPPPTDWKNLSDLLAEILGPVFLEVERQAPHWQKIRGSANVDCWGLPKAPPDESSAVDIAPLLDSFQLAVRNLQDVWSVVMPPTTLLEIRKIARLPANQFRVPDELWVRIVYDFALGHRLRLIPRDHLLRSLTPLYLGWIASYALEMEKAGGAEIDNRFERLGTAYEAAKPYLVSRWRWPDRFNP